MSVYCPHCHFWQQLMESHRDDILVIAGLHQKGICLFPWWGTCGWENEWRNKQPNMITEDLNKKKPSNNKWYIILHFTLHHIKLEILYNYTTEVSLNAWRWECSIEVTQNFMTIDIDFSKVDSIQNIHKRHSLLSFGTFFKIACLCLISYQLLNARL